MFIILLSKLEQNNYYCFSWTKLNSFEFILNSTSFWEGTRWLKCGSTYIGHCQGCLGVVLDGSSQAEVGN